MNSDDRDPDLLRLPDEIAPPPGLEDRVVSDLRRRGHLRAPRRLSPGWLRAAAAAVLLLVFGSGFALGVNTLGVKTLGVNTLGVNALGVNSRVEPAVTGVSADVPDSARYLLLLSAGGTGGDPAAAEARAAEYAAWARELAGRGQLVTADELSEVEWTMEGEAGGDAPAYFHSGVHTSRRPNGFFLLSARDSEEARTIAASCPHLRHGGHLSLRPIQGRD